MYADSAWIQCSAAPALLTPSIGHTWLCAQVAPLLLHEICCIWLQRLVNKAFGGIHQRLEVFLWSVGRQGDAAVSINNSFRFTLAWSQQLHD